MKENNMSKKSKKTKWNNTKWITYAREKSFQNNIKALFTNKPQTSHVVFGK